MKKEQIKKLKEEMNTVVENNLDDFLKEFQEIINSISDGENTTDAMAKMIAKMNTLMYSSLSRQMLSLFDTLLDTLEDNE